MTRALLALGLLALPAHAQTVAPQQLEQSVRVLASDLFEGRAPGTVGEERTIGYLVGRFQALGLEPGGPDGQWVQSVPLLHTRLGQAEVLGVKQGSATTAWTAGKDVYLSTLQPRDKVAISSAPLLFVGYGVSAPERGWDDFKGADLKGKVAVFLINDPDFEAAKGDDAAGKFGDRTMTYYGRWTYKFEEAARRGAVGALIVHDTPGAGYGWNVVVSPGGENYDLVRAPDKLTSLQLQGWIEGGAAARLFAGAGLDLGSLRTQARSKGFRPVELKGASFSAAFPVTQDVIKSANVLARIPGAKRPDETVMYGAHWDAYGKGAPDAQGRIYRAGANDDALGIAGLFEIARAFKAGPAPDRSILFAAWTAEERGLLGSEHYAQNPVWPLDKTVANLTIDILQTAGKAKDVILVGKGQGTLEDDLARAAAAQGRVVTPESLPERGLFYRADHFSMAKRGVPVLLMMGIAGASDLVEGGRAAGQAWVDAYTGQCYHQACDAVDATWKLDGAAQDVDLMLAIGQDLATSTRWPQWKPGSEFKSVRDASATARP
ncbi:MAG: M20/M25/M40 family metallo-hydrolase [Sphingobium sp.]|uniref:M28 family metallopeptidase n=1 Tax=Sphingobium sp. TaxID=1912891 RepID=UPI000C66CA14|nr:M28 family metallopeptidase [Sphingobium sp.]MBU0658407.1 M20/M25/M40 family metallo-hydrolase [Alphaproteobacteria bacterium]MBA4754977.1 M20/M25/M40 family metallo-hydrolase [Sphingobium sp.]MBS87074.1 peptidase M20 [Sphingobium sp.]MBU1259516.1 M20/M25/M40 family metallo-hydrolase [Alphaproteobacteria bacterium]MBU1462614.1 M20/M25/M40 family metallo-hydrolase [Alphaproteobacteria bacterium]